MNYELSVSIYLTAAYKNGMSNGGTANVFTQTLRFTAENLEQVSSLFRQLNAITAQMTAINIEGNPNAS